MIKGIYKNIVVVRDIESSIIEEAIFIVKPSASKKGISKSDMLSEAKRILEQKAKRYGDIVNMPKRKWKIF
jgi:hypothetical protein